MHAPRRRSGHQPHAPQPKANAEPTANLPEQIRDNTGTGEAQRELGRDGEDQVLEREQAPASSSNDDGSQHRQGRGPDRTQRHTGRFQDVGSTTGQRTNDWTDFDIGRIVRLFRTNNESAIRLSLR